LSGGHAWRILHLLVVLKIKRDAPVVEGDSGAARHKFEAVNDEFFISPKLLRFKFETWTLFNLAA